MLKPEIEKVIQDFFLWNQSGSIGRYEIIRSPKGQLAAGVEQMYKMHEIPPDIREHVVALHKFFGAMKMTILGNVSGPDRVEVFAFRKLGEEK
jgi:hypothetical protein